MSPGIDFETRLIAKTNLAERLEEQLQNPGYVPQPIALGINTDAYQPVEREQRLTRRTLEILLRYKHPLHIITKGSLILRDLDLLSELASHNLVSVAFSLTTLDDELKRIMEPRTAAPAARLRAMRTLHEVPEHALSRVVMPDDRVCDGMDHLDLERRAPRHLFGRLSDRDDVVAARLRA